jgi:release factor glutamine methyltransferase
MVTRPSGRDGHADEAGRREGTTRSAVVGRLSRAGCLAADEEAEDLLDGAPDGPTLETWVRRREKGEPLAWITGGQPFCGHRIGVDPGVFVPRPQSEELARRAAAALAREGGPALDLCTGSGAVACHLMAASPAATVVAVDVDARAVRCARANGVLAVSADLADPFPDSAFRVVTAVAPYVPTPELALLPADVRRYEPRLALDGGTDGLEVIRRLAVSARRVLRPGGWLFLEIGGEQDVSLRSILAAGGWSVAATWTDEDGDLRGLAARRGPG